MNRRNRRHYVLAAACLFTVGCGAIGERKVATITRSWPAASVSEIRLREVNGSVQVSAGQGPEIRMVAVVRSRGIEPDPSRENQGFFETKLDGETLSIGRRGRRRVGIPFFRSENVSVDYQLVVPPSVDLNLTTVNGRIATRGVDGEMRATTVNGSLDLEASGMNELVANTVNGRVKARFTRDFQGASLKTVNGSVTAVLPLSASFACELSQVNGDFEASFPVSIHSHPGRRRVSGEVNGGRHDLRIVTVNGDISLENENGSSIPAAPAAPAVPGPLPSPQMAPPAPAVPPAAPHST